jgi:hypothetical protein
MVTRIIHIIPNLERGFGEITGDMNIQLDSDRSDFSAAEHVYRMDFSTALSEC